MGLKELEPFGDELILLVLGPGFGESVLVRWPPSEWLVVDSCHRVADEAGDERHPAMEALRDFGGHPVAVALTHPHLDHTGGFSELVARRREGALVGWLSEPGRDVWWATPSGTQAATQGDTEHALAAIDRVWGEDPGSRLDLLHDGSVVTLGELTVEVLSPAQGVVNHVKASTRPDFNRASSAMLLKWRECEILLGADLTRPGWKDIENSHGKEAFKDVHGLKVSHHASKNAHHAVALGGPPVRQRTVIATPYNKGHKVPSFAPDNDVERFLKLAAPLHLTTHHGPLPPNAGTQDVPIGAITSPRRSLGRYAAEPDSPDEPLEECWVAARYGPDGSLLDVQRGTASMSVVAGP